MIDYVFFSLVLYSMNVEQVMTLSKQLTFIGLSYQNLASFSFFETFVYFTKFAKISTINKTCSPNHKSFPMHDLAHLYVT